MTPLPTTPSPLPLAAGGGFTSKRGVFGRVGKPGTMLCVAFSGDGQLCFSGGADGKIYHWTARSSLKEVLEGHEGPVFALQRVEKVGVVRSTKHVIRWVWSGESREWVWSRVTMM